MPATGKGLSISGLDDCIRWMDNAPESCLKATKQALKEASKQTTKVIKARVPKRWKRLVKYKIIKTDNGKLNAGLGMFNGHQQQGHQGKTAIDDWFKAYWANYGTLTQRDPSHKFTKPVRHGGTSAAKRRRNNVGQRAQNFFEDALTGYEDRFTQAFAEAMKKNEKTMYER